MLYIYIYVYGQEIIIKYYYVYGQNISTCTYIIIYDVYGHGAPSKNMLFCNEEPVCASWAS